jgi:hypothetical protein
VSNITSTRSHVARLMKGENIYGAHYMPGMLREGI